MKNIFLIMPYRSLITGIDDILAIEGGYSLHAYENGKVAWDNLKTLDKIPDIIICNYRMPYMSGLEFLKKLRADKNPKYSHLPFVLTSACARDEIDDEVFMLPIGVEPDYFLQKPFDSDELLFILEDALNF